MTRHRATRIAHVSDVHLDGTRARGERFAKALAFASRFRPDHLVITGDVTADGSPTQIVELADAIVAWPSHRVTIVPGNHDGRPADWLRALQHGPLARFAATSAPGAVVEYPDASIVAISSQIDQPFPLARGKVSDEQLAQLDRVSLATPPERAIIVAVHHGPQYHPLQSIDGLINCAEVLDYLGREPRAFVLCGHDHRVLDFRVSTGPKPSAVAAESAAGWRATDVDLPRVFTAGSVADHADPVRVYDVVPPIEPRTHAALFPRYRSRDRGRYLIIADHAAHARSR